MTDIPEIPDECDSEEELKAYVSQLHDRIETLEEELEDPEEEMSDLKRELDETEEVSKPNSAELQSIHDELLEIVERMEDIELHGEPSDVGLQDSLRDAF